MVPRQSIVPLKGVPQYLELALATVPVEKPARQRQHPRTFAVRNVRYAGIIPSTRMFATKEVHHA